MQELFIVDAVNYLFRSYYAIGPMTSDRGESTSALFGFIRTVQKLIKDFSAKNLVAVFDGPDNKKARLEVYAEYKMQRKKAPDDLYEQFDLAYQFCHLAGIPALCIPEVEADDTIASVALWAEKRDFQIYICSSDKDLFQLIGKNIKGLLTYKNNLVVDAEKVKELFGVAPGQMLDFLAMVGDVSDNIPGLSGFGPKTAASLLQEFKTLENILQHPEKVPGAKKQKTLIEEKKTALLSKQLATLNTSVKIPEKNDFYRLKEPDLKELEQFYRRMNFSQFLKKLKEEKGGIAPKNQAEEKKKPEKAGKNSLKQKDLFDQENSSQAVKADNEDVFYRQIQTEQELNDLFLSLRKQKEICIDVETTSLNPLEAELVGIGLGYQERKAFYLPCNYPDSENFFSKEAVLEKIRELAAGGAAFYGHNLKYDLQVLFQEGVDISLLAFDTMLASYLLNPQHRRHSLDMLCLENFGKAKTAFSSLFSSKEQSIKDVDIKKAAGYCCEDIDYTIRLKNLFSKQLEEKKLSKLLFEMELPLVLVLCRMQRRGIFLQRRELEKLKSRLSSQLAVLETEILEDMGEQINLNSPKQLSEVLFQKLKLPLPARKKTAFSTGAAVLEKLALKYPIAQKLLDFRAKQKLLTTYVDALPKDISLRDGRIHPTFNQSITATGRLSCNNPNLQNIPIRSEDGLQIRKAFQPQQEGWSFLSADYSQIELRLLAHFSEDPELLQAFQNGQDIHSHTASLIFKVPLSEVKKHMRMVAKTVNFGVLYGQGAYGLSQQLGLPFKEAALFIENYFNRYQKVKTYLEECKARAYRQKETRTLFGRSRPLNEIDSSNQHIKAAAERLAVNTPLQGTAADLIKLAMIEIDKSIKEKGLSGFAILQIHDELVFEVPDRELEIFKSLVKSKMENAASLKVALIVDMQVGKNWSEC